MGVKYKVVAVGEYIVKARLPTTQNHRKLFIPLIAVLQKRPDVVLLTHDESNMTVNLSQRKAYVVPGQEAVDERKKSGAGQGDGCWRFLCLFQIVFCHRNRNIGVSQLE